MTFNTDLNNSFDPHQFASGYADMEVEPSTGSESDTSSVKATQGSLGGTQTVQLAKEGDGLGVGATKRASSSLHEDPLTLSETSKGFTASTTPPANTNYGKISDIIRQGSIYDRATPLYDVVPRETTRTNYGAMPEPPDQPQSNTSEYEKVPPLQSHPNYGRVPTQLSHPNYGRVPGGMDAANSTAANFRQAQVLGEVEAQTARAAVKDAQPSPEADGVDLNSDAQIKEQKLANITKEFKATEASFHKSLDELSSILESEIGKVSHKGLKTTLKEYKEDVDAMKDLSRDLLDCLDKINIGKDGGENDSVDKKSLQSALESISDKFSEYADKLVNMSSKYYSFRNVIDRATTPSDNASQNTLSALMISAPQRGPRLEMLMNDIAKTIQEPQSTDDPAKTEKQAGLKDFAQTLSTKIKSELDKRYKGSEAEIGKLEFAFESTLHFRGVKGGDAPNGFKNPIKAKQKQLKAELEAAQSSFSIDKPESYIKLKDVYDKIAEACNMTLDVPGDVQEDVNKSLYEMKRDLLSSLSKDNVLASIPKEKFKELNDSLQGEIIDTLQRKENLQTSIEGQLEAGKKSRKGTPILDRFSGKTNIKGKSRLSRKDSRSSLQNFSEIRQRSGSRSSLIDSNRGGIDPLPPLHEEPGSSDLSGDPEN